MRIVRQEISKPSLPLPLTKCYFKGQLITQSFFFRWWTGIGKGKGGGGRGYVSMKRCNALRKISTYKTVCLR